MSVRIWTIELKEELYSTGLAFVWRREQEFERCNKDSEREV
jgi:hypothetical protein